MTNEDMRSRPALALVVVVFSGCAGATVDDEILLSGKVKLDPESVQPASRAFVRVVDANKSQRCFVTSCDGTFSVRRGDVPFLDLPLSAVAVERVDRPDADPGTTTTLVAVRMRGAVARERSCNACHAGGVSLFRTADAVPPDLRAASASCTSASAEVVCPEDRTLPPREELAVVRDFPTYDERVHEVLVRKCGSPDCHGGGLRPAIANDSSASFESLSSFDSAALMANARGSAEHPAGEIALGALADQCLAEWLGVSPISRAKFTHVEACRRAAAE